MWNLPSHTDHPQERVSSHAPNMLIYCWHFTCQAISRYVSFAFPDGTHLLTHFSCLGRSRWCSWRYALPSAALSWSSVLFSLYHGLHGPAQSDAIVCTTHQERTKSHGRASNLKLRAIIHGCSTGRVCRTQISYLGPQRYVDGRRLQEGHSRTGCYHGAYQIRIRL